MTDSFPNIHLICLISGCFHAMIWMFNSLSSHSTAVGACYTINPATGIAFNIRWPLLCLSYWFRFLHLCVQQLQCQLAVMLVLQCNENPVQAAASTTISRQDKRNEICSQWTCIPHKSWNSSHLPRLALHAADMPAQQLPSGALYHTGHLHHHGVVLAAVTPCTPDRTRLTQDTAAAHITMHILAGHLWTKKQVKSPYFNFLDNFRKMYLKVCLWHWNNTVALTTKRHILLLLKVGVTKAVLWTFISRVSQGLVCRLCHYTIKCRN